MNGAKRYNITSTFLISVGSWLGSGGGSKRRCLALILDGLQVLAASAVALTIDTADAERHRHPQARNIVIARESTAVVEAAALRLLLHAGLNGTTQGITLVAQTQQILLGEIRNGEIRLHCDIFLGQTQAGAAAENTTALRELAIARLEVTEICRTWDDIRRLSGRVAGSGLGDIQRNIEVRFLDRATKNNFTAKALAVNLAIGSWDNEFTSTIVANKANIRITVNKFADLGFILDTQTLGCGLDTPTILKFKVGATERTAAQNHKIFRERSSFAQIQKVKGLLDRCLVGVLHFLRFEA